MREYKAAVKEYKALMVAFSFSVNRSTILKGQKFGGRVSRCPNESSNSRSILRHSAVA